MFPVRWFEVLLRNGQDHVVYGCGVHETTSYVYFDGESEPSGMLLVHQVSVIAIISTP